MRWQLPHLGLRDYDAADGAAKRALRIVEAALGPAHPLLIQPLLLLGWSCNARGDHQSSLAFLDRVTEICSAAGEAMPASTAWSVLVALGEGMRVAGEHETALHNLQQAIALARELFGPGSAQVAEVRVVMAWVQRDLGDDAAAQDQLSQAIEVIGRQFGSEHDFTRRLAGRLSQWRAAGPQAKRP